MTMTDYEKNLWQECLTRGGHQSVTPYKLSNIVLFWPECWVPEWYYETGIDKPRQVTDWLEKTYQQMKAWTRFNPNEYYSSKNGVRDRLALVCNGQRDFVFGGGLSRPYVGLRDGRDPKCDSKDWFGWVCHELSHDFLHEPRFCPDFEKWTEGLCDHFRCKLLSALGMKDAAAGFEADVMKALIDDPWKRPAKLLLDYEHAHGITSPVELAHQLRGKVLSQEVACPTW